MRPSFQAFGWHLLPIGPNAYATYRENERSQGRRMGFSAGPSGLPPKETEQPPLNALRLPATANRDEFRNGHKDRACLGPAFHSGQSMAALQVCQNASKFACDFIPFRVHQQTVVLKRESKSERDAHISEIYIYKLKKRTTAYESQGFQQTFGPVRGPRRTSSRPGNHETYNRASSCSETQLTEQNSQGYFSIAALPSMSQ